MKSSITSFNEVWLIGVLVMIFFAWGCSDTTSFKEGEIDDSAVARSGSERVQGSKLSQEQLFTIVDSLQLSLEQERLLSVIRERPTTAEVHIARLANNPAALLKKDKSMVINVSPGKRFIVSEDTVTRRESNDVSWAGKLQDQVGRATLVLSPHGITGTLSTRSKHFRFAPLGKGLQALIRVDASKFPPEHPPNYSSEIRLDSAYTHKQGTVTQHGETSFTTTSSVNSGSADAGVLVVYTQAAENAAGDIDDLIQTAIDETNHSYDNSNIYAQTYLAHSAQVSYNEAGNTYGQHLDYLEDNSDGIIDNVHNLRDQYLADVVILIVNDDSYCGIANLLANSATAFGVVHYHCATAPAFSFGHEIGHLQGAQHDVDEDTNPYFTYGHGYVDPNDQWRTIMAYPDACSGCNRVQYWSNPNVNYPPTGQAMGTTAEEDNARVLNETRYEIRDFMTLPAPQNFIFTHPGSYGNNPELTWSDVSEADGYNVYRCITDDSHYAPSCFQETFGPIISNGSGWKFIDSQVTIDDYGAPCDKKAIYRVTSQNITGEATAPSEPQVCIDMAY